MHIVQRLSETLFKLKELLNADNIYFKKKVYFAEKQTRKGEDFHGACLQKKLLEEKVKRVSLRGGVIKSEMPTLIFFLENCVV